MGEGPRNVTIAVSRCSQRYCSWAVRSDHRCADKNNAQNYDNYYQGCSDGGMIVADNIQQSTTYDEYRCQDKWRLYYLHTLVSRWINFSAGLDTSRRGILTPILTLAQPSNQLASEVLLRHSGWMRRVRPVSQVTPHPHAPWGIAIECPDPVWDRLVNFRHVRHAVLRADWRGRNRLRNGRHADGQCCHNGELVERIHFEILRAVLQRCGDQSNKVLIVEIDDPIGDPVSSIPSGSSVLDFALAALEEVDWLGALVAKPISKSVDPDPADDDPAPVGHRKAHMLSRVRINNRGPARVTNDRHSKPQWFPAEPQKYLFSRQRTVEVERAIKAGIYFLQGYVTADETAELESHIGSGQAENHSFYAFYNLIIRWQPLAPADALDIAGAA